MGKVYWLIIAIILSALSTEVIAHQVFLSSAKIAKNPGRQVSVDLKVGADDLKVALDIPLTIRGGAINSLTLIENKKAVSDYLIANIAIANGKGDGCALRGQEMKTVDQGVALNTKWDCAKIAGELFYQTSLFFDLDAAAGQLVNIKGMTNKTPPLLNARTPKISLTGTPPTFMETTTRFIASGIEHIFIGYDHIAFLIALLLWARHILSVIKVITAFTIAHTITLSLATLEIITLPTIFVEGAIAATIVFVAAENFFRRDVAKRWPLTFFLGLIHGFGFASVLKNFGLPENALVTALAMFNIGVEIGQIAIIGICLPVILGIDHLIIRNKPTAPDYRRNPVFVYLASGIIILLGIYWFIERVIITQF